ncbi:uncharacterized protein PSFLO_06792 [Pseudozyma flocculosa]|uniref:Uncharacterized protein n=1 Tax=Pseudozyma flocculosa TaxID=84751 RepID=A0A5C3FAP7_9BASI|nr:uncharacterized protein PSFLO_06792 [Pseudozyma flocculosa]
MEDNRTIEAIPDWSRQRCLDAVVLTACSSSIDVRAQGYRCLAIATSIDRSPRQLTSVVILDRGRLPTVLTVALGINPPFPNLARASDVSTEAIALRRAETSPPLGQSSAHRQVDRYTAVDSFLALRLDILLRTSSHPLVGPIPFAIDHPGLHICGELALSEAEKLADECFNGAKQVKIVRLEVLNAAMQVLDQAKDQVKIFLGQVHGRFAVLDPGLCPSFKELMMIELASRREQQGPACNSTLETLQDGTASTPCNNRLKTAQAYGTSTRGAATTGSK